MKKQKKRYAGHLKQLTVRKKAQGVLVEKGRGAPKSACAERGCDAGDAGRNETDEQHN